jgi:hypothetical protein
MYGLVFRLETEQIRKKMEEEEKLIEKNKLNNKPGTIFCGKKQCGDRRTDQPTNGVSYRGACSCLKTEAREQLKKA